MITLHRNQENAIISLREYKERKKGNEKYNQLRKHKPPSGCSVCAVTLLEAENGLRRLINALAHTESFKTCYESTAEKREVIANMLSHIIMDLQEPKKETNQT